MRLPAITPQQIGHENCRERHEAWYQAFLAGERVTYQTTRLECEELRQTLAANSRAYWVERGFRVRTSTSLDKSSLTIWLESMVGKQEAA